MPGTGLLGVVVLTHGDGIPALELVRALLSGGIAAEDIVVVHNPTRGDEPRLQPDEEVDVLRMERNAGYATGMNTGIRHQLERGVNLVLTLTHEVRFRPGALAALVEAALAAPHYGVLGPMLWWQGQGRPLSYGGNRRPRGGIDHVQTRPDAPGGIAPSDWIDGAALLYRREALERAGLLEERFFIYVEDADICLRISRSGFDVGVVVDAVAEAAPGGDARPGAWYYLTTRNGLEYARRLRGARGVMWELARRSKESAQLIGRCLDPRTPSDQRARCRLELQAKRRGTLDFFRGNWGPPPPGLAGTGDLVGTSAGG